MAQKIRKGKRKWFPIYAPTMFNNQMLGETFVWETESIPDKHLTINLMSLTGNPKKQNYDVFFKVVDVKDGKGVTKTLGLEMQHSTVKRLARRGRTKVADSFLVKTKKDQFVRIKPVVMTRSRADNDVQSALRLKARSLLRALIKNYNFETVVNDIINMRLQKHVKQSLDEIFPVRSVDIRYIKYEKPPADDEEDEVEQTDYAVEDVKPKQVKKEDVVDSIQSLKAEVEEALAADKEEQDAAKSAKKPKKKGVSKMAQELEDEDSEDEESNEKQE